MTPKALIVGCAGPVLLPAEADLFAATQPLGFILFGRNCVSPEQLGTLVAALRGAVGRPDAPVLIDQEGGRVARLKPPHWPATPAAATFGEQYAADPAAACRAARDNANAIGRELAALGIDVDCAPDCDLHRPETTAAIGNRAFSADPEAVADLASASCEGFAAAGILPVIKHAPGHGRATVDSHLELPVVSASHADLTASDFVPFRRLSAMAAFMTAHLVYTAIDPDRPATQSPTVINDVIRGEIGFDGFLFSDDISMQALSGSVAERTQKALDAGCDAVLHCTGDLTEMQTLLAVAPALTDAASDRWARARRAKDSSHALGRVG